MDQTKTLRDEFAMEAMSQFVVGTHGLGSLEPQEIRRQFTMVADFSYMLADEMLKAREA